MQVSLSKAVVQCKHLAQQECMTRQLQARKIPATDMESWKADGKAEGYSEGSFLHERWQEPMLAATCTCI